MTKRAQDILLRAFFMCKEYSLISEKKYCI